MLIFVIWHTKIAILYAVKENDIYAQQWLKIVHITFLFHNIYLYVILPSKRFEDYVCYSKLTFICLKGDTIV